MAPARGASAPVPLLQLVLSLSVVVSCARGRPSDVAPAAASTQVRAAAGQPGVAPASGGLREVRVKTRGAVTALAVSAGRLSFCDEEGLHQFELPSGRAKGGGAVRCPPGGEGGGERPPGGEGQGPPGGEGPPGGRAPRTGAPEVSVRTPDHGPDDIVEIAGVADSFPIEGHATDWASDEAGVVIVATASQVLRLEPASTRRTLLSPTGASRVAVGAGWAAWWDGGAVCARPL